MKLCKSYTTAGAYNLSALHDILLEIGKSELKKDVIHFVKQEREAFFFSFGSVVFWGFSYDEITEILQKIEAVSVHLLSKELRTEDEFDYEYAENSRLKIHQDQIILDSKDELSQISLSYAIAQSVKLSVFENTVFDMITKTEDIPRTLAKTGSTQLSRSSIAKLRGELFLTQSSINLSFDLLDIPDFFWEYPDGEPIYQQMAQYLEISPRIEVMNKKLEVIHNLFTVLAEEQNHKHSSILEWIIIILIVIEVIITVFHDLLKWF